MKGRLLRAMAISDKTAKKINGKINGTSVAGMLDLGDILKLVDNRLDNRPLTG
jgi:hypothetical protein